MSVESINTLMVGGIGEIESPIGVFGPAEPDKSNSLVFDHLLGVDENIKSAEKQTQLLAIGEAENIHQVMISIAKAKSSFELTAEVRNRLLESYQQVMRMQV